MSKDDALPRSFRFARNFRWSMLGQCASIMVGLVATPLLVKRLGTERYGLYILLQTVSSYLMMLTFGTGSATVKFVAALKGAGDGRGARQATRYSLIFHGPVILAGCVALILAARPILTRVFHIPEALLDLGAQVLALGAVGAFFFALSTAASCTLQGLQRFAEQATVSFLQNAPMTAVTAILVGYGFGLRAVAVWYASWNAVVAVISLSWTAAIIRRAVPDTGPGRLDLREFSIWGAGQWMGQMASIVISQFDRLLAVRYTTLTGLTIYSVPASLLQRLQIIPGTISVVMMPIFSELRGSSDLGAVRRLYLRATRLVFGLTL